MAQSLNFKFGSMWVRTTVLISVKPGTTDHIASLHSSTETFIEEKEISFHYNLEVIRFSTSHQALRLLEVVRYKNQSFVGFFAKLYILGMGAVTLSGIKWLGRTAATISLQATALLIDSIDQPNAATSAYLMNWYQFIR